MSIHQPPKPSRWDIRGWKFGLGSGLFAGLLFSLPHFIALLYHGPYLRALDDGMTLLSIVLGLIVFPTLTTLLARRLWFFWGFLPALTMLLLCNALAQIPFGIIDLELVTVLTIIPVGLASLFHYAALRRRGSVPPAPPPATADPPDTVWPPPPTPKL